VTEILRFTKRNEYYLFTAVTPLCFIYQPINDITGNVCGKLFLYTLANPPIAYPTSRILVYQCMTQKQTLMAFYRKNCTVPSTLSPEHPQRIVPYVGGLELTVKPRPTFCVSVKLWLHPDTYFWVPVSWLQWTLRVLSLGAIWNCSKEIGLP
jgi:hypothetical protein